MNQFKFLPVILLTLIALVGLNSCASLKSGTTSDSAVGKLSAAIETIDVKVPQFVTSVFSDSLTIEGITKQHIKDLQDPLNGFAGEMFTEWQTYSQSNANRDNDKYISYKLSLPKARGPLSKRIVAAVNSQLVKVFDDQRKEFKKCRENGTTERCRTQFVEKTTKQLSALIEKVIRAYYQERLNKL